MRAVLEHVVGPEQAARFTVLAGDVVEKKKPAPDIYELALTHMAADPTDTLVIEDSRNGLLAAAGAGLACVVTVSSYTADEDFSEAVLVVTSLGEPDGAPDHRAREPGGGASRQLHRREGSRGMPRAGVVTTR